MKQYLLFCLSLLLWSTGPAAFSQTGGNKSLSGVTQVASCCSTKTARCTGDDNCRACTNCSRCAWCKGGGTCGVCRGTSSGRGSSSGSTSDYSYRSYSPPPVRTAPKPKPKPTPVPRLPAEFVGKVVGVTDGDTLTVLTASNRSVKIRLYGIDAPEKAQPFGEAAKQALSNLAYGREVTVRLRDKDQYGRAVADITVGGKSVNQEQVRRGMAWWFQKYAPYDSELKRLEAEAKSAKRGLWRDVSPAAPWDWRRKTNAPAKTYRPKGVVEAKDGLIKGESDMKTKPFNLLSGKNQFRWKFTAKGSNPLFVVKLFDAESNERVKDLIGTSMNANYAVTIDIPKTGQYYLDITCENGEFEVFADGEVP